MTLHERKLLPECILWRSVAVNEGIRKVAFYVLGQLSKIFFADRVEFLWQADRLLFVGFVPNSFFLKLL